NKNILNFLLLSLQIFRQLERPAEEQRIASLRQIVRTQRQEFISVILNTTENLDAILLDQLEKYEMSVQEAAEGGLLILAVKDYPQLYDKWSMMQAVFFSSTVLTTIGEIMFLLCF
uniref:Uncharacterized protein n=1 Tax=Megaselia scalaris TaxID=36166 RepID=T1GAC1_MEGSC